MFRLPLIFAALLLVGSAGSATTCEALRAQIDTKIRAAGVQNFTLSVMDAGANADGKVVGNCDLGTRKIVYLKNEAAPVDTSTPGSSSGVPRAPARSDAMLTECKEGYVSTGGDCRKK